MKRMTRTDFIKMVSTKTGKTQKEAKEILDLIEQSIVEVMKDEDELKLQIGTFKATDKGETKARNPKTNQEIIVPAKRVVKLKVGKFMKDGVQ